MRKIQNHYLKELLMQLKFTSAAKRLKYLSSTEKLLDAIDPVRDYPFDFVCFKITGYHPKGLPQQLIRGSELASDLRIFLWKLSGQVADPASSQSEKVYRIEELAEMLGVSTKTISRWRDRGLVARKFTCDDGKKRLAVRQSSLDAFLKEHPRLAQKARGFKRLSPQEIDSIVQQAKRLASQRNLSRRQIIADICKKTDRGHETIRTILMKHDRANPRERVFKGRPTALDPVETAEIYRLYRIGWPVARLAEKFGRSKSAVYRVIRLKRARAIRAAKIEFVPSDEFVDAEAAETILQSLAQHRCLVTAAQTEKLQVGPGSLTRYLQVLKTLPRLTRDQELDLFRGYNYLKWFTFSTREEMHSAKFDAKKLRQIERYLSDAEATKQFLIQVNLPLVVGIASRHATTGMPLQELISEGNLSLMRAVERFDYTKGFRFATYASWIIAKRFARIVPAARARPGKAAVASLENIQQDLRIAQAVDIAAIERARKSLAQVIRNELNEREQYVVLHHYGLTSTSILEKPKTLKQIGEKMGLTKERVRQIELTALQKLKQSLSSQEFEMLTG